MSSRSAEPHNQEPAGKAPLPDLDRVLNPLPDDQDVSTLHAVELGVLGPLQVRQEGTPVTIPGAKPRAILTMLGLHGGSVISAETLLELLWGDDPPRTAAKALATHISALRRTLGDGFVLTEGTGWILNTSETDASRYKLATRMGRDAAAAGEASQAVARFEEALTLWRGTPELPDTRRGISEKTRWIEGHAALEEDRAAALLATGRAAEIIGELEAAVAEAPLRERRWGQLMLALYRAGRQGEALAAYQRARSLLVDELGVDPGPELRRLEAAIVAQDAALDMPVAQQISTVTRAVTFLLTDIEGSTAAWEADADAMAVALARHDELVEQVVTSRGGRLIKTRGEGDATFSVFDRPSSAAAAAMELQDAIIHEPWVLREPMRIRVALHTGEAELRDGDYFGRAVNRAARLRSLAEGGQILCSGATAELVIDSLPDDVVLADLGMRHLKNLVRPEHVFELRLEDVAPTQETSDTPLERPVLPAVLTGPGPFVGRRHELEGLMSVWQTALTGGMHAILIAGEPGVGKTRLAGEWSHQAYAQGAIVLYGRCDEDLGAPYQPFAEALRSLVPPLGAKRLRGLRGVEALLALVPGLTDVLPDLAAPTRADPDTERYALFDAVVRLLEAASTSAPVVLILDDLHWAAKPTLLLLRHLLRFGDHARVQIVGTYRSTDLDRSHPLAAMLADLHRDGTANRLQLSGLNEDDVTEYVTEAGYDDEELARALASVTGGNPFFLIEALRHVDESGGIWDPSTLPQGVRETVSRRLSRLSAETNKALAAAAVVGSRFALDLVEHVVEQDLVDAFDEACKAGIVIEEPGGRYRFNHAIVRQSLLAELASVRRMRLHQRIAATLEAQPGADDELLAELAHHYFECAWAGNAAKAVEYCRRAADQAMARLGYEGAADLYDRALHALEEIDDELPDRDDQVAELLIARCEALLAAGDVTSAVSAVSQLQAATVDSARLAAWATCFDGQLSVLIHPERLDEVEAALGAAAAKLAELDDAAGEATAHTVRATCLARLGRIADCEIALDDALTAARRAQEHRRVNAVLAGAPLAALWGPNPVPRAGGRCLDVVRLLRITTDSPAVEATSTRCQAVLEAFRGRGAAARRMIESARRTVTELGLRHALLEVEQFAGIVELVIEDPVAAEPHLRKAYNGFRRMGLDADTAETAALLGRTCLALGRDVEADELCTESERLAGHALKPSIASRALRARLLSRADDHDGARRVAEEAVKMAERTDALVDHGDACLTLATVLAAAGDVAGARAAAERAADLYERKGAAALAERARQILEGRDVPTAPAPPDVPAVELVTAAVRTHKRVMEAIHRKDWDEFERLFAPGGSVESRRKVVGFKQTEFTSDEVVRQTRGDLETGAMRVDQVVIAVRGERLALAQTVLGTADVSAGAPRDEFLQLYGIDDQGRIAMQMWFDVDDMDAALAELDALHARFEHQPGARRPENAASRQYERFKARYAARDWRGMTEIIADDFWSEDRRHPINSGLRQGRDALIAEISALAKLDIEIMTDVVATRGARLVLSRVLISRGDQGPDGFDLVGLDIIEVDAEERTVARIVFDEEDLEAAIAELDARYLAGEAASHARVWSVISNVFAAHNRREIPAVTADVVSLDHRRAAAFAPGEGLEFIRAGWDLDQTLNLYIEAAHRLNDLGAVFTWAGHGTSHEGFDAEWRGVQIMTVDGEMLSRAEVFDEEDLDAALAKFDQLSRPALRLENTAIMVLERYIARFAARDWDVMTQMLTDDFVTDDRRRVVNAGVRRGRDAEVANMQSFAEIGMLNIARTAIATRGEHLVLCRHHVSLPDWAEPSSDVIGVVEISPDNQISAHVMFDADDFDAAIAELDSRYLAGEAADHAHTWSVVAGAYAALSNGGLFPTTPDWVNIDHRRGIAFEPGDLTAYIRTAWNLLSDSAIYAESVHALSDLGAVFTWRGFGTSQEGSTVEFRGVNVVSVEGELVNRCEVFDEADLDFALAKFDQLSRPAPRLENTASRVSARYGTYLGTRDWDSLRAILSDDFLSDDRRRMVGSGVRHGRDAEISDLRAIADLGLTNIASTIVAIRGERLVLTRVRFSGSDIGSEAIVTDILGVIEVNANERITATVTFDPDDVDAATAELDGRYMAGEAAAQSRTWSVIAAACAALNRREMSATTPDYVIIDHRLHTTIKPGDLTAYTRVTWDLTPELRISIEAVHRLTDLGAVITISGHGTSREGFDAQWRMIQLLTVEGDLLDHCELFEEADLDAALARFDELHQPAQRLENAARQAYGRFQSYFAAENWDALAETLADDFSQDDRRRVIGAGLRRGRDAQIADSRAFAEIGANRSTATVIATRGERLVLCRSCIYSENEQPGASRIEFLSVVEITADERMAARDAFDLDDIEAAIADLDDRYIAGEAAPYAHTWSLVVEAYAALNRREHPATTPNWVNIDHRRGPAFAPGDMTAYTRAVLDLTPDLRNHIEAVHRLSNVGAVLTHAAHGTSQEGFEAEWRVIDVLTFEGDRINRLEIFDEANLDAAIARFDELTRPTPRLENAASQAYARFRKYFAARDWTAMADLLTADTSVDDHRRVVNAEIRHGREVEIANMQAFADIGANKSTATVIATRGERLVLCRTCITGEDQLPDASRIEFFCVVEITADEQIAARTAFDLDDLDAAVAHLDARYLAGEAAEHSRTWSVIAAAHAGFNRQEILAVSPDTVYIDHRPVVSIAGADVTATLRAVQDITPDYRVYIEAVHRLDELGAVATQVLNGTTQEGLDAEWRMINIYTIEGDQITRVEVFDEADLDAALARFDELQPLTPRLENTASQVEQRYLDYFAARDWDAAAELVARGICVDDRRRVVNAGVRHGRDAEIANLRGLANVGVTNGTSTVIAVRGGRLFLGRQCVWGRWSGSEPSEMLGVIEIDAENQIAARVLFDPDDIDAAFAELDARYIAGEAAAHAHTWSVIARSYSESNRHELPGMTADSVLVDHRPVVTGDAEDLATYLRSVWDLAPDIGVHIEAVHRLSDLGGVITHAAHGTSQEGFVAEWRTINVLAIEGDLINRVEVYDETDLDAALARYDEVQPQPRRLENTASRVEKRFEACLVARDWVGMADILTDDTLMDDRRRVSGIGVRRGRDVQIADMTGSAKLDITTQTLSVIATRGERLALYRARFGGRDQRPEVFYSELLVVVEIDADERIVARVMFEPDDIDAAVEELDGRYLAGEASAHSETWSAIANTYAAVNRREFSAKTPDWVGIDHRRVAAFAPGEWEAYVRSGWDLYDDFYTYVEAVHRLGSRGAVFTHAAYGTTKEGFDAEWRQVIILTFEGGLISRGEVFDEADLDAALARFDELDRPAPLLDNASTRIWARMVDAYNRRDMSGFLALMTEDARLDDRRKGLRGIHDGLALRRNVQQLFQAHISWRLSMETIAIRGSHLSLTRHWIRDMNDADQPITWEALCVTEVGDDNLMRDQVIFDINDINDAFDELTARWIASGEVAYPEVIETHYRSVKAANRHDWDSLAEITAGATFVDHRQLAAGGGDTIADHMPSIRTMASLVPDLWLELTEILAHSAYGVVTYLVAKGMSAEGIAIELPLVTIIVIDGERITHVEDFDPAQRDLALARFEEIGRSG
jgi:DNA-binding SARP family transcriptional activator